MPIVFKKSSVMFAHFVFINVKFSFSKASVQLIATSIIIVLNLVHAGCVYMLYIWIIPPPIVVCRCTFDHNGSTISTR